MKICFVLPQMLRKPVGGYKMVYEYANRLSDEGHHVGILFLNDDALKRFPLPSYMRKYAIKAFTEFEPRWFKLNKLVKKYSSTESDVFGKLDKYELVFATHISTVEPIYRFFPHVHKAYFIQDYETWEDAEDKVLRSYALGMDNIVVSIWLKRIVDQYGKKPALLLSNPIDTSVYKVINPVKTRDKFKIGVLYHVSEHKGFTDAYKAIQLVKRSCPQLEVLMFGTSKPDFELPEWLHFTQNASQEETVKIYNEISVFVCATIKEGFGLTGLEAMACGAVLVSTEYDGAKEYAVHEKNALLSPIGNVEALSNNIKNIIENSDKRHELANNGIQCAQKHSWENAMSILNSYISAVKKVNVVE